jgi:hypothetical protein
MQRNLRFALFGNTYQEHKSAHVTHLLEILRGKGAEICISNEFYDFLKLLKNIKIAFVTETGLRTNIYFRFYR